MKKSVLFILFLSILITGCYPDCTYKESFTFKREVPDIQLAVSDSVIIDMSRYWKAKVGCDKYTPVIKQAKGNKSLIEIRSIDEFLILKGHQKGESEVSVIAEKRNATDDTAECQTFNASSEPISFSVSIGNSTDFKSDKLTLSYSSRISSVNVTPETFTKGDTVQLEFKSPQPSVSLSTWFTDSGTFISEKSSAFSDCVDGYVISQSKKIMMIVESENQTIEGYVHNDRPKGNARKTGIFFNLNSQN